ncbi:rho GTPase-activating protein 2-like [Dorcoceras hygrometricum]|uniref:Rho GTPase-activating protein 2-like n=1 Tax=Dorcoceras hygrometricum TaxID=472368 RepID=A0A2Z7D5C1_9LAMI|nr:rho GTPase-activating protein 2-like [Dorcoceras hygrometricum]
MVGMVMVTRGGGAGGYGRSSKSALTEAQDNQQEDQHNQQLSVLDFILVALRKSMVSCRLDCKTEVISAVHHMDIGFPTNVQHVAHVTFDRFNGFSGLPVEFEVEIPCKVPSASVSVFGVSADSMQCSYDTRGNSVPTILLLMQERLYTQGGLKAEGIFRINPENSQEENVRGRLNSGVVPDDIDVHCLAGLIKAWFRELPSGVLDGLRPEQVLQCSTEEESVELIKQLKPTESALLNWAVNLMADVVEYEEFNKMNPRNIAMVFAPNMTQMSDPLTALMHAVQVLNLLKTLITRTLRERDDESRGGCSPISSRNSFDMQSDEEYDSQQEMDTSCVGSTTSATDDDHEALGSPGSNDKYEVESLSEIEECFLRRLDENETAKNDFRKQLEGILCREHASPNSTQDSGLLFSDSKMGSSCLSTSDGEDSRASSIKLGLKSSQLTRDVDMEESVVESANLECCNQ